jgi:hypothetical protein
MAITKATSNAVAPAAKGDLVVGSATNDSSVLAVGSTDQVLTVDSSTATGLKWATPSSGGMTLISEQAVSAVSSVTFGSIAQTYKQLYLVWSGIRHSASGSAFSMRLNNDSSAIYRSNYPYIFSGNVSVDDGNYTHIGSTANPSWGTNANSSQVRDDGTGFLILDNYTSTTRPKLYYGNFYFHETATGNKVYAPFKGVYDTTTAITSIDIVRLSGTGTITNNNNSSIRLYGIS